jgi:hypothetical protein
LHQRKDQAQNVMRMTQTSIIIAAGVATKQHFGRNRERFESRQKACPNRLWQNGREVNCLNHKRKTGARAPRGRIRATH